MPTTAPIISRRLRRRARPGGIDSRRVSPARPRGLAAALAILLPAILAASPSEAARRSDNATVKGTVTSLASGDPLDGVEVTLEAADGSRETTTTDRKGRFSIEVPAGEYTLGLAREGYSPFTVRLPVEAGARPVVTVELLDAEAGRRSAAAKAYNLGAAALAAGDRATAKSNFLAAVEADPTLPEPRAALADIYFDEGAWAEAAAELELFLAARPDDRAAQRAAYEAYRKLEEAARVVALRATLAADPALAPKLAVHAFNEGVAAKQAGDAETARARFSEALGLDAGLAAAQFALAAVEYEAGRHDEALAAAERGLALEPDNAQGRRLLFVVQEARGDKAATAAALAAYAEVDAAAVAEIFFQRGDRAFLDGDTTKAIAALTTVLEHQPEHTHAHRLLGLSLLSRDAARARSHLRRFLELAPDDPEAADVREILANF